MLKIDMTVVYEDGRTAKVTAGPVTQVAFEREHSVGIGVLAEEQKLSHLYWLAWHASRSGVEFDAWLESITAVDVEVDTPTPTEPAQPAT